MNEYTRREEVRWMLTSAGALLLSVTVALVAILTAKGKRGPDVAALDAATSMSAKAESLKSCDALASELSREVTLALDILRGGGLPLAPSPSASAGKSATKGGKSKSPAEAGVRPWEGLKASHERAKLLTACEKTATSVMTPNADATAAWQAIAQLAALNAPPNDDAIAQQRAVEQVNALLAKASLRSVESHLAQASKFAAETAERARATAKDATVELPLPKTVLPRSVAVGAGLGLQLTALFVSLFSVRSASLRRASGLSGLRRVTTSPERGLQAATILRAAAEPHGGEPGLVLGAAVGGMLASLVGRADSDWFVAGVTLGLLFGLIAQLLVRSSFDPAHGFRERALALADLEKPAIPMVLVLSSVPPGAERQFLSYFLQLPPAEASVAVERMAEQAEEQILAAADAQAMGGSIGA